jgi:pilus assembly protein CpaF
LLGERRSNSLFAPTAPAEPERKPEQAEVHDISFEERTGRSLFAETATAPTCKRALLCPAGERECTFAEALSQVQGYLSETYATLITEDNSDAKEQMKRRMPRYLQEKRIAVDGMTARTSWWTPCTRKWRSTDFSPSTSSADGIEEIDINSWRDIEIQYSDGHHRQAGGAFRLAGTRRQCHPPYAAELRQGTGQRQPHHYLPTCKNIRISVIKTPVVDEDVGVAASIRIVNPRI